MKNVKPALLAAVAVFIWSFISWSVLPWHQATLAPFANDAPVAQAIKANATAGTRIYFLPGMRRPDGAHVDKKIWEEAVERGPVFMGVVRPGPSPRGMILRLLCSFLIQFVGTLVLAWILQHCPKQTYQGRVGVCAAAGFFAGVVAWLPPWNWWDFPFSYVLVGLLDLFIGGIAAGLVLARFIKPHVIPHHQF
ncbi:MAG: hypothetical protein ACR2OZ_05925 [Verrucomicrobiales bacterium]